MERGHAAAAAHDAAEAARWFEKEVEANPGDAQARAWLGQALCSIGRREDGIGYLLEAGAQLFESGRSSGDMSKVFEIATQLQRWGDFEGAAALLEPASQVARRDFRGFQLLAVTYAQLNRKTDAVAAGEEALRLAPANAMMQVLQASLEADLGRNEAARQRLRAVLDSQPDARVGFRAHKEMARIVDKLGAYEDVFPHLHAAGHLSKLIPEYAAQDATLIPKQVEASRRWFDPDSLRSWAATPLSDDYPPACFLMGFMRSGTTLTQEVLDAHPGVFVSDEVDFLTPVKRELQQLDPSAVTVEEKIKRLDVSGIARLRKVYWTGVREHYGDRIGARLFVDKFTMSTVELGLIDRVFPDARIVFVMRDPRDVCLSCFMQLMVPTPTTVQLLSWEGTAQFYTLVMDWWLYMRQAMTVRYIEFRYEDAVSRFEPTYRAVFDFLGLSWDPAVVDFHARAARKFIASPSRTQVAQPLYSSSVGRWRLFGAEFEKVAERLDPFVKAFHYEPS